MACDPFLGESQLALSGALDGSFEGAVQSGFCLFVLRLRDLALLVFDFKLEQFFLEGFEQHGWARRGRRECGRSGYLGCRSRRRPGYSRTRRLRCFGNLEFYRASVGDVGSNTTLPAGYIEGTHQKRSSESSNDPPAILLQRVRGIDWWTESSTRTRIALTAHRSAG